MNTARHIITALCCSIVFLRFADAASTTPRIVSLKPNITEILFALGLEGDIVGVTKWCNYPAAAQDKTIIGDYVRPSIEGIINLRPTLVIGSQENSAKHPITQLKKRGINVHLFEFSSLESTAAAIESIGTLTNRTSQAKTLAGHIRSVQHAANPPSNTDALIVTSWYPLIVAGPSSFIGRVAQQAGIQNSIQALHPAYPNISTEHVISMNPSCIIDISHPTRKSQIPLPIAGRLRYVDALVNNCIRSIDVELLRAGPRIADGVTALREAIHVHSNP